MAAKTYSYDENNVFARILRGELPCDAVMETDFTLVMKDIRPQAPQHVLVIPKGAYVTLDHFLKEATSPERDDFFATVGTVLERMKLPASRDGKGYRVITNAGEDGFQEVPHLHVHILGGRWLGPLLHDTPRTRAGPSEGA